jgi:hypothetical protein
MKENGSPPKTLYLKINSIHIFPMALDTIYQFSIFNSFLIIRTKTLKYLISHILVILVLGDHKKTIKSIKYGKFSVFLRAMEIWDIFFHNISYFLIYNHYQ